MKKTIKSLLLTAVAMVFSIYANAQITTASLGGKVTDEQGSVAGVAVIATHTPSGTVYYGVSNSEGRYSLHGLRAGGPYEVKYQLLGYETVIVKDIFPNLGEVYVQDVAIKVSTETLNEVVVVADASKFSTEKTGASTSINTRQMQNMPTVNRSISDLAKLSPYANGMSFAGGDGRSTNFTVDGSNFNNNFGLSSNLPGGGNPISIEALEEMQVVIAPFDVRQTNFIGGGINAITKSGTNTFKASAYGYYRNQNMRGNTIDGVSLGDPAAESVRTLGATVGGPIIKDKLFFFANFEQEKRPGQIIEYRARKDGEEAGGNVSRTLASDMEKVYNFLKSEYGYDAGSWTDFAGDQSNMKILARLDWNINRDNKLSLRFNYTKNSVWSAPNGNSSDTGYRLNGTYRVGPQSMCFSNNMYSMDNKVQSWSLDWNSRFSDNVSNQFLATFSKIEDIRGTKSSPFPQVDIMYEGALEPYMSLGYELFTWNNGVHNNVITVKDDVTILKGDHKITAGANYEYQMADNAYMRNGALYYRYKSLDDFLNKKAPESFAITYGWGGELNPAARVTYHQIGAYAQDEWQVNSKFKLTFGVRFDTILFDNKDIATNNAIYALEGFKDAQGNDVKIDTGKWPTTKLQVNPRIGFVWDALGDKSFKVRGGTGLFQGRLPLVYFTNMPTNAGMVQNSVQYKTKYDADNIEESHDANLDRFAGTGEFGGMITTASEAIEKLGLQKDITPEKHVAGNTVSGVDRNFRMPQVWKTSLAVDYQLPVGFPFTVTAEGMFNKTIYGVNVYNVNVSNDIASMDHFEGADQRAIYSNKGYISGTKNAPYLCNTTEGYGYTANVTINMTPAKGLDIMAAYTHTESKEVSGLPGSDPLSTWQGLITVNGPNTATAQRSQYVVPDKLIASVSYYIPNGGIFGRGSHYSLFYTGMTPYSNSFCYSNDMNGDGINNDLMYIYKTGAEINWKGDAAEQTAQAAAYDKFMAQDKYLQANAGKYAEAYAARSPWVNRFDLHIAHDFAFGGKTKHNFQLIFDFMNIGNMINSSWGVYQSSTAASNSCRILKYEGKNEANQPIFSMNKVNGAYIDHTYEPYANSSQCWNFQIGLRYNLN